MLDKKKKLIIIIASIAICIIVYKLNISCPIKTITGIPCAGCGMTRAFKALFRLDFNSAFQFHPLFWTAPLMLVIFFFSENIPKKIIITSCIIISCLFIYVYIIRLPII